MENQKENGCKINGLLMDYQWIINEQSMQNQWIIHRKIIIP